MHEDSLIKLSNLLTQKGSLWPVWMFVHILLHCWPPTHHLEPPRFENLAVDMNYHTYTLINIHEVSKGRERESALVTNCADLIFVGFEGTW